MAGSKPPRGPSDDDAALWGRIAQEITPLRRKGPKPAGPPPEPAPVSPAPKPKRNPRPRAAEAAPPPIQPPASSRGRTPGLDRRTADRLRRGQLPIDARLDLHGHNREEAHSALIAFVREAHAAGGRCLLVITGKGNRSEPDDFGRRPSGGVLRRFIPGWLADPELARRILATAPARPQHGGDGALYLLLRRAR
jgi:DNA-nicking Smr family endonuclease